MRIAGSRFTNAVRYSSMNMAACLAPHLPMIGFKKLPPRTNANHEPKYSFVGFAHNHASVPMLTPCLMQNQSNAPFETESNNEDLKH